MSLSQPMKQIDTGITSAVWATDPSEDIYFLSGKQFQKVAGKLIHVTSGASGVWGVNRLNQIFFRDGVTLSLPKGVAWKLVAGGLMQIDSGPKGVVCGVAKAYGVYCREGITDASPTGTKWFRTSGLLKYISCGGYGYWGVNAGGDIFFTRDVYDDKIQKTNWEKVDGSLRQIEAGPNGEVWGVNANDELFTRIGVTQGSPTGFAWKRIGGRSFVSVTVGQNALYAIDVGNTVYSGTMLRQAQPGMSFGLINSGSRCRK